MNKFDEILSTIKQLPKVFETEEIALEDAYNRVLREDVRADMNMPPFHKSAMDGYACHIDDIANELEVLEVIQAGMMPTQQVGRNQCSKIMTGAAVPDGCDCVFKVEDSEAINEKTVRCINPRTARNICYIGENYRQGDILIKEGTMVSVPQMAVLAGAGYAKVKVSVRPKITVIATGSELVKPEEKPQPGQIRNSNSSQVITQLRKMNLEVVQNLQLKDDYELLTQTFNEALGNSDIVIFTGGASVGDFDFIPEILKEQGFKIFWDRTGFKPGNPMTFSQKGNKFVIGLSGNPVSSLVQFELLAKPAIYQLMGANYAPTRILAKLNFDFQRKKADRLAIVPVFFNEEGLIEEIPFHGSAHINALISATALMEIPLGTNTINKGETVYVRPL
ncbi:molybdopterin molybdotransferase MoeA [Maribellus sp. YY47]|uniref:molybdopterin molybdotransferase MoeA n=1 Tax=Maribellus sp. YY47 TaxID=2929486 RepID=UPI0020016476|nr:molybdopterin molybdotransferase MoeA [Maribellus sp. YY47]MCK3684759.1 molybdopterin molybdotransferase MoeA [Maribellus sp. YY47]